MRSASFLLPAAILLALAGCATVGPDYAAPELQGPELWQNAPETLPTAGTARLARWWEQLNDPLLTDLIRQALASSPDLRLAQARLRESRARGALAEAGLAPTLDASGSASRGQSSAETGTGATRNVFSAGFDARWEADLFGGTRRAIEAARADLQGSEASLKDTQVTLAAEVARNYIELRAAQARLRIARDNLASQTETLNLTEWRAQAGLTSALEVEQARANREQTRAQIPPLETSLAAAEYRLAVLLGETPGALYARLAPPQPIPAAPAPLAVGIPADTLRQRPDVRVAERRLAAETARIGQAEAARYPALSLSGSIGLDALALDGLTGGQALSRSILAGLTAPIFDGGRLRSQVDVQTAVRDQAAVSLEQTVLGALEEVENALVALARGREREAALAEATASARKAAELARQRYASGLIDFQTVLTTERSVLTLEDSLASAQASTTQALIQLYKALGGGWSATPEMTSSCRHCEPSEAIQVPPPHGLPRRLAPNGHGDSPPQDMKRLLAMSVSLTPALSRLRERGTMERIALFHVYATLAHARNDAAARTNT
ncbi:MAG: efflux transporter outer membrane subunit [Pseudomonadota bacterium]